MDRRKSLKAIAVGTLSAGILLDACKTDNKKEAAKSAEASGEFTLDRAVEEQEREKEITSKTFFTPHEMATITVLADIIIPKDEVSGSASDAKVPDFIEYIVKDKPENQIPMRGGLRWLDVQCLKRFNKSFVDGTEKERMAMVDEIAWPNKAKPDMAQGVAFFNLMRDLTASGFYTSEIGVKDLGYAGNTPNKWNGVPDEVLKQYGLAYTEKEMKECAKY
ncbi:transcriptional initiation protein Tat [Niastella yeongjuensis]|uniref:Transcriptional initiation protein Tat n=1 Tax=Niastella yeongjuensis TaxID=354355 RepID=A0A1V9EEX2_9BACT|nr:gluconate 2-dehydrogenase subunit 3 family protein [Niastella yeongjuensis]OQP44666.1 transcriptional initiation protein Tat [Niastella yeongjuensis]SEO79287.1 Gluconate 2-dehydrogenase subunit 3 [Niastella yeongjuensis]